MQACEGKDVVDAVLWIAGAVALAVGTLSAHLDRWSVSPPLLALVVGVVAGPQVTGLASIPASEAPHVLHVAAKLLLAVALMAIALRYPIRDVRAHRREVTWLLVLVMPVMVAVTGLAATWTLGLPLGVAAVLGAALAPTDPVLASGIVTGASAEEAIPSRDRQVLSIESGANDGLAQPFVVLALAWALGDPLDTALATAAYEVVGALAVGAAAGYAAGRALRWAERHREITGSERSLYTLVLAAFLLGATSTLGMDGLLAVFVGGLAHSAATTAEDRRSEVSIDEPMSQFLVVPVFVLLGVALPWSDWGALGWGGVGLVAAALLLRRPPIVLLLRPLLGATRAHVVWLGWFGPIGVAALFYLGHAHGEGVTDPTVWAAGTLVIAVSTVVHGLTAGAGRRLYRDRGATSP